MKTCPTCNRTFEDNLTFCLSDGTVLDPPIDPDATILMSEQLSDDVGLIPYYEGNKWGLYNPKEGIVIPPRYDFVSLCNEGIVRVTKHYPSESRFSHDKIGFVNAKGEEFIPVKYGFSYASFSEGLVNLEKSFMESVFVDSDGRRAFSLAFEEAAPFSEGLAAVKVNGKWGFVNKRGQFVIHPAYERTTRFSEGLAGVRKGSWIGGDRWGFIDTSNETIVDFAYTFVDAFSNGLALASQSLIALESGWTGECGFIDKNGKIVIPFQYYDRISSFREGRALACPNRKWGFLDEEGYPIIEFKYSSARQFYDGRASVADDEGYGFIDRTGYEVTPLRFKFADSFSNGLANVKKGSEYGYIDIMGNEVISFKYDSAAPFFYGLAEVTKGGKRFFIDRNGTEYHGPAKSK